MNMTLRVEGALESGQIEFTQEELDFMQEEHEIYVAGNPDLFPIESYEQIEKRFIGVIPDYFNIVSEITGIRFRYMNLQKKDNRFELAKDKQVEIVSGFVKDNELRQRYNLETGNTLLSIPEKDTKLKISLAYTSAAEPELISIIEKCLDAITSGEKESILLKNSVLAEEVNLKLFAVVFLLLFISVVLGIIMYLLVRRLFYYKIQYSYQRYTDELTEFGNYNELKKCYNNLIHIGSRCNYWVMYIDLDLARVLSIYGIEEMKEIILMFIAELNDEWRDTKYYSRVNGNYLLLLIKLSSEDVMGKLLQSLSLKLEELIKNSNKNYELEISIGAYQLMSYDENLESAVQNAMQALKYAQENKTLYAVFDKKVEMLMRETKELEQDVLNGLLNDEFVVYLQPYFSLAGNCLTGCEALVRWENEKLGLLKPYKFIAIMEKLKIIDKLDLMVFENVCKILQERDEQGKKLFMINCNFSKQNFLNPNFANSLISIAKEHQVKSEYLSVEITEGLTVGDVQQVSGIIKQLSDAGFPLVIDNFGSEYTSFLDLSNYPVNIVKLDKKLIDYIELEKMHTIIKGLIDIAHQMGMSIMCRGVESEEQVKTIKNLGCDFVQGYYFYEPMEYQVFISHYDQTEDGMSFGILDGQETVEEVQETKKEVEQESVIQVELEEQEQQDKGESREGQKEKERKEDSRVKKIPAHSKDTKSRLQLKKGNAIKNFRDIIHNKLNKNT